MNNYLNKPDAGAAPQLKGAAKDNQRRAEHGRDQAMRSGPPQPPVQRQIGDNLPVPNPGNKPTRQGTIQGSASPPSNYSSGMESALGGLADKLHPPKRRK